MKKLLITLIITIIIIIGTNNVFAVNYKIYEVNYTGTFNSQILENYISRNDIYNNINNSNVNLELPFYNHNGIITISNRLYKLLNDSLFNYMATDTMISSNILNGFKYFSITSPSNNGDGTTTRISESDILYSAYSTYNDNTATSIKYYQGSRKIPTMYIHSNNEGAINIYLPQALGTINEDYSLLIHVYKNGNLEKIISSFDIVDKIISNRSIVLIGDEIKSLFNVDISETDYFSLRIGISNSSNTIIYSSSPRFYITKYQGDTPGTGGGSSSITGTITENGDINLNTTPITDNIDKNTEEIINKLEENPTTTEDDFKNNFSNTDVEDPSNDFFTWIFENLENIFLSNKEEIFEFSLYTDNVYQISSSQISVPDGILKTLVGLSIDFGISYWILKDVRKTINKVKEGNIESLADDDITANMV